MASSSFWRLASKTGAAPAVAGALFSQCTNRLVVTSCDAPPEPSSSSYRTKNANDPSNEQQQSWSPPDIDQQDNSGGGGGTTSTSTSSSSSSIKKIPPMEGMRHDELGDYYGMFPRRQLWRPKFEYPLWDTNWDGREPPSTGNIHEDRKRKSHLRRTGVTRHIILVRHGQYDETHREDEKRVLTPLGRRQADLTGKRLAEMMRGAEDEFGPCPIKVLRVSNMARARETADIIASHLSGFGDVPLRCDRPDPILNEGRPCHHVPGGKASTKIIETTDDNHPRIEEAFHKFFFRAPSAAAAASDDDGGGGGGDTTKETEERHEFEVIVCHANVIRYFCCRALQLPPETWLRFCPFNCSLTYVTIRPTGTVSCRMLGDIGHLPYGAATFSRHRGFNW